MTALTAQPAPVEPVVSADQLQVLLVTAVLGMATVCVLVVLVALFRSVYVIRQGGRR